MLGRKDNALHTGCLEGAGPLLAVEPGGVETAEGRIAIAPLAVIKGIGAKVYKGVGLQLLPGHLVLGGNRGNGSWGRCLGEQAHRGRAHQDGE